MIEQRYDDRVECSGAGKLDMLMRMVLGDARLAEGDAVERYEQAFARFLGARHVFAFWKGRVGLHVVLRAIGIGPGDHVLMPGYTCVVVPGATLYTGASPRYVDIEPEHYNLDPELLDAARTPRTRALVVQHTYGFPAQLERILDWAERHDLPVIEDCCHALGSMYRGRMVGTFGIASFFSSQWNKHYTTGIGGLAVVNDDALAERVRDICRKELHRPGRPEAWMLAVEMLAHHLLVYPRTLTLAQSLFRYLTAKKLVIGSASAAEFTPHIPDGYIKAMSNVQALVGLHELGRVTKNLNHRRRLTRLYDQALRIDDGRAEPEPPQPLVRYPIRVRDRKAMLTQAARKLVELGTWFECPLHPKETDHESFGYTRGQCPVAERAAAEVLNLPVHLRVSEDEARRIARFALPYRRASDATSRRTPERPAPTLTSVRGAAR